MKKALSLLSLSLLLGACNQTSETTSKAAPESDVSKAICKLTPTDGHRVSGLVSFSKVPDGVKIEADVFNLTEGDHGFHIHEWGDITTADGSGCGGHFNPDGCCHGGPHSAVRHAGDLGNLTADTNGYAHYEAIDTRIQLGGKESILGRSIIVHEHGDDLSSQPTGGAGPRAAQGVIGIAIR